VPRLACSHDVDCRRPCLFTGQGESFRADSGHRSSPGRRLNRLTLGRRLAPAARVNLWAVVLAGGRGLRLSSVTGGVPKQFWAPRRGRTLLEDTLERIAPVTPATRTITVVDRSHWKYAETIRARADLGQVVPQPIDKGTAIGVLLGLSEIDETDAIVVLTPADHGVQCPEVFRHGIDQAARTIQARRAEIVLFAVEATSPTCDYGWVLPAGKGADEGRFASVGAFVEKPDADRSCELLAMGGAWSTMVVVARAEALLHAFREQLPVATGVFRELAALPRDGRLRALAEAYPTLARADFSHDLLGRSQGLQYYVWPRSLGWTDLGTPERLESWLSGHFAREVKRLDARRGVSHGAEVA
jgi:mannose-1-phosphate guanylyltransferase